MPVNGVLTCSITYSGMRLAVIRASGKMRILFIVPVNVGIIISALKNEPSLQTESQKKLESYSNFEQLLALINEADFIFGSDSLPIHLCHVLKKPHFILYPCNGSDNFFTPYALQNKYYLNFKEVNENSFTFLSKL